MAFWNKKSISDILIKSFKSNNITLETKFDCLTFELKLEDAEFNLYPYFKFDEDESVVSIVINLSKVSKISNELLNQINDFNISSKYFVCKHKDDVIYLEYNSIYTDSNIFDVVNNSLLSLNGLVDKLSKL